MNLRTCIPPALLLGALLACGGGGSNNPPAPVSATRLTYTDPTTGSYLLKRNATLSTSTHLVLDLCGPAGASGCGASASFTLGGTAATWKNVAASDAAATYVANGTAFNLGSGIPILKAKLTGSTLVAAVAEKGLATPKTLDQPLLRVAVDLVPGSAVGASATLTVSGAQVLQADGTLATVTVASSPISAQ